MVHTNPSVGPAAYSCRSAAPTSRLIDSGEVKVSVEDGWMTFVDKALLSDTYHLYEPEGSWLRAAQGDGSAGLPIGCHHRAGPGGELGPGPTRRRVVLAPSTPPASSSPRSPTNCTVLAAPSPASPSSCAPGSRETPTAALAVGRGRRSGPRWARNGHGLVGGRLDQPCPRVIAVEAGQVVRGVCWSQFCAQTQGTDAGPLQAEPGVQGSAWVGRFLLPFEAEIGRDRPVGQGPQPSAWSPLRDRSTPAGVRAAARVATLRPRR